MVTFRMQTTAKLLKFFMRASGQAEKHSLREQKLISCVLISSAMPWMKYRRASHRHTATEQTRCSADQAYILTEPLPAPCEGAEPHTANGL